MALFSFLFGSKKNKCISVIDVYEFKKAVKQHNVQLIDVRTPNEFSNGHIEKAVNVDFFNQNNFGVAFTKLDKKKPLYIYCRSGKRSSRAAKQLAGLGFEKIYDLEGGYIKWCN
ncbi:rhodanese-like domain-containing protein [Flavobacteriaceae bacterium]|nr:rhodanese-like domain-containing protein [Flavobacteriaceae bacterium]